MIFVQLCISNYVLLFQCMSKPIYSIFFSHQYELKVIVLFVDTVITRDTGYCWHLILPTYEEIIFDCYRRELDEELGIKLPKDAFELLFVFLEQWLVNELQF